MMRSAVSEGGDCTQVFLKKTCSRPGASFIKLCVDSILKDFVRKKVRIFVRKNNILIYNTLRRTSVRTLLVINTDVRYLMRSCMSLTLLPRSSHICPNKVHVNQSMNIPALDHQSRNGKMGKKHDSVIVRSMCS